MYRLSINRAGRSTFASILKDEQPIGPLSGLFISSEEELEQLRTFVAMANLGLSMLKG